MGNIIVIVIYRAASAGVTFNINLKKSLYVNINVHQDILSRKGDGEWSITINLAKQPSSLLLCFLVLWIAQK